MNMKLTLRKSEEIAPIFGLRYLEEEDAEVNGIAGCNVPIRDIDPGDGGGGGGTYYTTNCDYADYD